MDDRGPTNLSRERAVQEDIVPVTREFIPRPNRDKRGLNMRPWVLGSGTGEEGRQKSPVCLA